MTARWTGQSQESTRHPFSEVSVGRSLPVRADRRLSSRVHCPAGCACIRERVRPSARGHRGRSTRRLLGGVGLREQSTPASVCLDPVTAAAAGESSRFGRQSMGVKTVKPPPALAANEEGLSPRPTCTEKHEHGYFRPRVKIDLEPGRPRKLNWFTAPPSESISHEAGRQREPPFRSI